jgi:hypothetical protein
MDARLHVPTLPTSVVLQLPTNFMERFIHREKGILALRVKRWVPGDDEDVVRHQYFDSHSVVSALAFAVVWTGSLDEDMATRDARIEVFQAIHLLSDPRIERVRRIALVVADLKWHLHF